MKLVFAGWIMGGAVSLAASLEFSKPLQEAHPPADADSVVADFEFTNRSNRPVDIKKYDAACTCMKVQIEGGKLRYAPGESGVVRAEFGVGSFSGTVDKTVALWLDDDPGDKPSVSLTLRVHIPELIVLEPKTLSWDLAGDGAPKTIRITMKHTEPIRIKSVTGSSEAFVHELKTIKDGTSYELVVHPIDATKPGLAIFRIETDSKLERFQRQQAFAVVRKPSTAQPLNLR